MPKVTPLKHWPSGADGPGIGEFERGDVIDVEHGGTGCASLPELANALSIQVNGSSLPDHTHGPGASPSDRTGGRVSHTVLLDCGTYLHTEIDDFIDSKGAPSGLAPLNVEGYVNDWIELPLDNPLAANVTAAPGTSSLPARADHVHPHGEHSHADASTGGTFSHTNLTDVGTNTHAQIDTHLAAVAPHSGHALTSNVKGLISSNTTIYVSTTGSDVTGDGTSGNAYASIIKALDSIKNYLIAAGVVVTIQVGDGTYNVTANTNINHPDADKIQIYGNTSAETTLAVTSINTGIKTFTVSGDQTSLFAVGDIFTIKDGTAANRRAYTVVSITFVTDHTDIVVSEAVSSSTVGGANITVKPCNKCILSLSANVRGFNCSKTLRGISGFHIKSAGGASSMGVYAYNGAIVTLYDKMIVSGAYYGLYAASAGQINAPGGVLKNCGLGVYSVSIAAVFVYTNAMVVDGSTVRAFTADAMSFMNLPSAYIILHSNTGDYSPLVNTTDSISNSFIKQV